MNDTSIEGKDITGRHVVLKESVVVPAYRDLKYRIILANGGFGCHPDTHGSLVVNTNIYDGDTGRWNREDIERFATPEEVEAVLNAAKEEKPHMGILEDIMDQISRHDSEHPDHGVGCVCMDQHAGRLRAFFTERGTTEKSFQNFCTIWSYINRTNPTLKP